MAAVFLLALGAFLLVRAGWDVLERKRTQTIDLTAFERPALDENSGEGLAIDRIEPPPPPPEPGELIGVIRIPSSDVEASIREGVGDDVLAVAAGHLPGTALPGEVGNAALAAHRDGLFSGLKTIAEGDVIEVETTRGRQTYRVTSLSVVDPTDVSVLEPTSEPTLTLITCYPFRWVGPAPQRFIVRAALATA